MIADFKHRGVRDIFDGLDTKAARKIVPTLLQPKAAEVLDRLNAAVSLTSLNLPGLKLEKLRGDRAGQHSIRINAQFRVCFRWTAEGPSGVEIVDYH